MRNVFVQTNEATGNQIVAFRRAGDGSLELLGRFETGGRGDGVPHLTSQGSVVLTSDGRPGRRVEVGAVNGLPASAAGLASG